MQSVPNVIPRPPSVATKLAIYEKAHDVGAGIIPVRLLCEGIRPK